MERRNGHRAPESPSARRSRRILIVASLVALVAVAFGGGYLLARGSGETDSSPAASPTGPPSVSIEPSTIEGPPPSGTPSSTPAPVLEDGSHFVYARSAVAAPRSLRVDLAEFLTGEEAQEAAEDRGDEVTNDYYIVNDERRLRSVPVSDDVIVLYVPRGAAGPDLVDGTWDAFVEAVSDDGESDIDGDAPWWITIEAGGIVQIEQQYLP